MIPVTLMAKTISVRPLCLTGITQHNRACDSFSLQDVLDI